MKQICGASKTTQHTALNAVTIPHSVFQSQLLEVGLVRYVVAVKLNPALASAVLNRHRNPWQVNPGAVLHAGRLHILCIWLHVAATVCLLHQGLADAAAGTHFTWAALHPALVVSVSYKASIFNRSCLQVSKVQTPTSLYQ